ncbi:MAG: SLBB domain-containing protein [Bacteroidales bacterium]|nr:SLBB domain-containing protein [Bacteroidales bacterium]
MKRIVLLLLVFVSLCATAQQLFDIQRYRNADFSKIPEQQVKQISSALEQRKITFSQARGALKAQGLSEKQLSDLERRLKRYSKPDKNNTTNKTTKSANSQTPNTAVEFDALSEKGRFLATHEDSLIFGFSLFNNDRLTFEPSLNIPVTDEYILGPGDEIIIDIWGLSSQSYELEVSSSGSIEIPIVGPVYVSGLSLRDAKRSIEGRLKTIYSDLGNKTSASIKTGKLRTVKVNVLGEVFLPGTYTVSGASSLFNVLYLSGGPNRNGSFRNIQLIRNGRIITTLDVYDFLLNGKSSVNVPIYDNDIIMVPTYQKRVAVGDNFKRTGYFEAKEGETVADLIRYAGGYNPSSQPDKLELYSVGKKGIEMRSFADDVAANVILNNGDSISVKAISFDRIDNMLTIEGSVFVPGNYEFTEGIKLSQLITQAGGLTENAFLNRGVITRLKDDYTLESLNFNVADVASGSYDLVLKAGDKVLISSIDDMRTAPVVEIKGSVLSPGIFEYRENLTLGDLILLAGGLSEESSTKNVEVARRLPYEEAEKNTESVANGIYVTITRDLNLSDESNSFALKPFDVVTVRAIPTAGFSGTVTISGEVMFAGTYELLNKSDNISSLIKRAGGLTSNAFVDGARLYRKVVLSEKEKIIKYNQMKDNVDTTTMSIDQFFADDNYELVSTDLRSILLNPNGETDLQLRDGDEIVIPQRSQTVKVSGVVLNPVSMTYMGRKSAKKYVKSSGGFGPKAKKGKTFVIHANGEADATSHFLFFRHYPKVLPGSEVVVPEKPERDGIRVSEVVSITSTLATIAVLLITVLAKDK